MNRSIHILALCAATLPDGMATCAAVAPLENLDGWKLIMPAGAFKANDGRAGWTLSDPTAVIAASKLPALVDFDHGTQTKNDSRAAAWIEELKIGGPAGEPGLWARMEGTPAGKAALAAKDYRFFSPTFLHDAKRVVTKIIGGSLVNNPALDEIPALASTQETTLDRTKLITALGLPATATDEDILAAIKAALSTQAATAAQLKAGTSLVAIAKAAGLDLVVEKIGDTEVTAICGKLKTPAAGDAELRDQVATLTTRLNEALLAQSNKTAEQMVDDAVKAGKIAPALKTEMLALCVSNPQTFAAMLAKAPVVLKDGTIAPQGSAEEALSADEVAICAMTGLSHDDFKAERKAQQKGTH